eukprot:TRINITY_DN3960_c0_g4_i1.p1 TRINITY_DN3960_c0_g4~~TRINITY_DN3960_c0_g4_i1.p1  ORF type:complete len:829 (+),score=61.69 TRINITY_DN3960_c0_g4_i1:131-2617(+)
MTSMEDGHRPLLECYGVTDSANGKCIWGSSYGPGLKSTIQDRRERSAHDFVAAILCCFLSVTGGVALGGYIFPSDEQHPNTVFQVAGMQIGLLASSVSTWVAFFKSDVYCGVPGGIFPPVIALGSTYFRNIGPEYPHTIMLALPLITLVNGFALFLVARLPLEQLVRGVPYVVYCGFLAGTGVICIQGGLEMASGAPVQSIPFWETPSHWTPPLLVAVLIYAFQQVDTPAKEMLLPAGLMLLAIAFYLVRLFSNHEIDLTLARTEGWLYSFEVPQRPGFYHVWSLQDFTKVHRESLLGWPLVQGIASSFILSVLCIVEDLYGVVESTGIKVNMKREMENAALMNVLSGFVGSMPTNLVMSYSVTAYKSGAKSRSFLFYLSVFSTLFFLFADYIIALMPKMVPAAALIWVGLAMCWDVIYKGLTKLSRADYLVVWMMILLDVVKGPDVMLCAGLAVTSLQLAHRLSAIKVLEETHTSRTERSTTLYPLVTDAFLEDHGDAAMILHLAKGLLFFGSAFQIQERVEHHLSTCKEPLRYLVLDLTQIEDTEVSGIKELHYIVDELAETHNFVVVFVGLSEKVTKQFDRFFVDTVALNRFAMMNDALRFVEKKLLEGPAKYVMRGSVRNSDIDEVRKSVTKVCGASPFLSVAVDVHSWLNNYTSEYAAEYVLPCLVNALTFQQFSEGEDICVTMSHSRNITRDVDKRAPLIWILLGRVDLIHDVDDLSSLVACETVEAVGAGAGRRKPKDIVQIAEVDELESRRAFCAGPLDTLAHFFSAFQMPPVTARVVSKEAKVALLSHSRFETMPRGVARLIEHYATRKQFAHNAMCRT